MNKVAVLEEKEMSIRNDSVVTPMTLIEMAVTQNADVDKLEKLWELQQRYEAAEARKSFVAAMAKFRDDCPAIVKTKNGHNSKYAGLAETIATIKQVESDCGLSHSWRTNQTNGAIEVTCVVTHKLGHSEETTMLADADSSGSKNKIQAIGSSVTYLQRYTLYALLGLASSDDDLDGNDSAANEIKEVRDTVVSKLKDKLNNGTAIQKWLKDNDLHQVRTATFAQLSDIEKALDNE